MSETLIVESESELAGKSVDGEPVVAVGARSGLWYTHIVPRWADDLEALELASYPTADPDDLYDSTGLRILATDFPQGCFAGFDRSDENNLVAMGLGIRTFFDLGEPQHTIDDIVPHDPEDSGDDPDGHWYYGTGISVRPEYRRRGIGRELYQLRKSVCRQLNLRGIVAGGVMPGYAEHRDTMSPDDYIRAVVAGELYDPTLTFQKDNGFVLGPALAGYITDPAVNDYASLIVWHNPGWNPPPGWVDPEEETDKETG
ncbi:MAG: GNAT family N-acetyltransferase [Acidimicrobiia bacterium]|nr:GNAT family N-acetyltransferase [Acidimicrobiia bacterium]